MKIYIITVLCVLFSLISVSCSTTSQRESKYVDDKGNPISEQQYNDLAEEQRLRDEEEAFYDKCDAEDTGRHWAVVDETMWLWSWVPATRRFIKSLQPDWW